MKSLMFFLLVGMAVLGVWAISAGCSPGSSSDSSVAQTADLKTATFSVDGMTCGGCEAGVKMAVKKLDGVHEVEASYENGRASVKFEPDKVNSEQIKLAIEELGYKARLETES